MAEVKAEQRDDTLVLFLSGRIDSANAGSVEAEIRAALAERPLLQLVLDAEQLTYISSAGLRIVLRLRKEHPELKMVNVNSEVYEILDMTGFTEMMPIEKGYRRLSVEGCEVIGKGSNGAVYRLDPETVIKFYPNSDALPEIRRERELARKAFVLGIPTAIPYDVVKVGDGYGSVFELLNARSLSKILTEDPGCMEDVIVMYVDLLKKIHMTEVSPEDLPDMKSVAIGWASDVADQLPPDTWRKLMDLLSAVPENHHMIHGDYHTKNVMVQNGEALLIDMDTIAYGDPVFEFASMFNAYIGFYAAQAERPGCTFIGLPYDTGAEIWERTLRGYFGTEDRAFLDTVTAKASLVGYTRILRRTLRRCDMTNPANQQAVAWIKQTIDSLVARTDSLTF